MCTVARRCSTAPTCRQATAERKSNGRTLPLIIFKVSRSLIKDLRSDKGRKRGDKGVGPGNLKNCETCCVSRVSRA